MDAERILLCLERPSGPQHTHGVLCFFRRSHLSVTFSLIPLTHPSQLTAVRMMVRTCTQLEMLVKQASMGLQRSLYNVKLPAGQPICLELEFDARDNFVVLVATAAAAWAWGHDKGQMVLSYGGRHFLVGDPRRIEALGLQLVRRLTIGLRALNRLGGADTQFFDAAARVFDQLPEGRDVRSPAGDSIPSIAARAWLAGCFNPKNNFLLPVAGGDLVVGSNNLQVLGSRLSVDAAMPPG